MTPISKLVADKKARQLFWTALMTDEEIKTSDRLKASELLARSEGDFLERIQPDGRTGQNAELEFVAEWEIQRNLENENKRED